MRKSIKKEGDMGSRWGSDKGKRQKEVQGDSCVPGLQSGQPRVGRKTEPSGELLREQNGTDGSSVVFVQVEKSSQRNITILLQSLGRIRDGDLEN